MALKEFLTTFQTTFNVFNIWAAICYTVLFVIAHKLAKQHSDSLRKVPRVGLDPGWFSMSKARKNFLAHGPELIEEGYSKFKHSMFRVQTNDMERLIISTRFIPELSRLPEETLSVAAGISVRHLGKYTALDFVDHNTIQVDACRIHLTNDIDHLTRALSDELRYGMNIDLPSEDKDWVSVNAFSVLLRLVARSSARVFVGKPLCRDEVWLETSIGFAGEVFLTATDIRPYANFVRPFVAPFLKSRKRLLKRLDVAAEKIVSVMKLYREGEVDRKEMPAALWMMDVAGKGSKEQTDPNDLGLKQLFLSLAALHTTTTHLLQAVYDLCANPEYVQELKKEIEEVLGDDVWGSWNNAKSLKLQKMDSFLKESQRVNHPGMFSFNRVVMKPITLSNGTAIPPGTLIGVATKCIANDSEFYKDPQIFDPWRFYKLTQNATSIEEKGSAAFTSTSPTSMVFGHGRRACPGRFFAAHQLKLFLVGLLTEYEFRFPKTMDRPKNLAYGEHIIPDKAQDIAFRKI